VDVVVKIFFSEAYLTIAKKFREYEEKIFTEVTRLREQLSQNYDSKNPEELKNI
jgi:hypothetical protein